MTKVRFDNYSTEFGLWTRNQPELDSNLGFVATDIDWFWGDHNNKRFLFMEEKRFMAEPSRCQISIFRAIHNKFINTKNYYGFHIIQFENTNPDDGRIFLRHINFIDNKVEIDRNQLIQFLQFNIYWNHDKNRYYIKSL